MNPLQSDRVDELVERRSTPRECLRQADSFRSEHEREHLGDEHISHRMHDRIAQVIDKDHSDDCACSLRVLGFRVIRTGTGPAGEDNRHTGESDQVLRSPRQYLHQEGTDDAGDEVPTGETEVDNILLTLVSDPDSGENPGKVVRDETCEVISVANIS